MENNVFHKPGSDSGDLFIQSLFDTYFKPLVVFVPKYIDDQGSCEDIVQDIFMSLVKAPKTFHTEKPPEIILL